MRHEHDGPFARLVAQRFQNHTLVKRIEVARRLVQQHERRVVQERTCDADALALPSRKRIAQLADVRVVAVRQRLDEVMDRSRLRRRDDALARCAGTPDLDIAGDRVVEQPGLLRHVRLAAAQIGRVHMAQIARRA